MFVELLPYVNADESIPHDLMLRAFNEGSAVLADAASRRAANDILVGAGDYLRMHEISAFIQADLSDANALTLIAQRKLFIDRARLLVPTILRLVGPRTEREIESVLLQIEDCCYDFPIIKAAEHPKKINKRRRADLLSLKDHISEIINIQSRVHGAVDLEYSEHKHLIKRYIDDEQPSFTDIDQLIVELKMLSFCADISLFKHDVGLSPLYTGDNKAHTLIVSSAYSLSRHLGKLAFVTTPGSDFSLLCGLIFELATGKQDESLAGAINKFSRSDLRREIDEHNAILDVENSDDYAVKCEANNFDRVHERVNGCLKDYGYWKGVAEAKDWGSFEMIQIHQRMMQAGEEALSLSRSYGPHLVWAIPRKKYDPFSKEFDDARAKLLAQQLELGRLRRGQKGNLPDWLRTAKSGQHRIRVVAYSSHPVAAQPRPAV